MKTLLTGIAAISFLALAAPAFARAPICISTRDIRNTTPQNGGAAILFKMNNGTVWRNDLHGRCPDLDFNGFSWTVRNPDSSVCENEQVIRVLRSGEVCTLGKFTQITPARHMDHPG